MDFKIEERQEFNSLNCDRVINFFSKIRCLKPQPNSLDFQKYWQTR